MSGYAAAIQAAVGSAASLGGALISSKSAESINKQEMANADDNRRWQTAEREAQNAWSLEQWNRENEYNAIGAQIQRARDAGLSPLSVMNGANAGEAAHLESASPASAPSMPHLLNPGEAWQRGLENAAQAGQAAFLQFQQLELAQKRTDAEIKNLEGDTAHKWSLAKTEDSLRDGRVDFLGVQIDVGKSQLVVNNAQVKSISQSIEESRRRCDQLLQWCAESRAKVSLYDWQKYCEGRKLPYEVKLLGQQILLTNQQALTEKKLRPYRVYSEQQRGYGMYYDNQLKFDYINSGQYKTDRINRGLLLGKQVDISHWQAKQAEGHTHSDAGFTYLRGMEQAQTFVNLFTSAFQGFMFQRIGAASIPKTMPVSTPNPASAIPMNDVYLP